MVSACPILSEMLRSELFCQATKYFFVAWRPETDEVTWSSVWLPALYRSFSGKQAGLSQADDCPALYSCQERS